MHKKHFQFIKKLRIAAIMTLGTIAFGVIGFMIIEGYSFSESFYTTIIILSTVGLGVVKTLSDGGRWFVSLLIIISIGIFAYGIAQITSYIMEGEVQRYLKLKKILKMIDKIQGHVIVCGYGRNGKQACKQLRSHNQHFVVIENSEKGIEDLREDDEFLFIHGDATRDEILIEAGIEKACALITTLPSDAANVFVVLTARELRSDIKIISRASESSSEGKLRRAGADNVIMPDKIGGSHMATLVTRPDVLEFIDHITGKVNIRLEEIMINKLKEVYQGKTIRELEVRNRTGANIIGFKTGEGEYIINPSPDTIMKPDSKLFVLGTSEEVEELTKILF
ncbi:MAG: potassium channel protein [Bacteroidia bacterium]|jgi:voltage-gated potassium channel|nr:potassium channel protein [Bacteroidia bacterium]MBP7244468.1 potassium channel protein [Bacteroidia bacterium]